MAKLNATKFMMSFVQEYLDGDMDRLGFELDFNHYLIENYPKMELEYNDLAEYFYFCLGEQGHDKGSGLSDDEHKELIRQQFDEFKAAMRDGIF